MAKITRICALVFIFHLTGYFLWGQTLSGTDSGRFIAEFPKDKEKAAEFFLSLAESAVVFFERQGLEPPRETIRLIYCPTEKDFLEKTGLKPEHIVACASARRKAIFINGERFQTLKREDLLPVMIHEYAHIYLGLKIPETLPHWLNEGLAMHLAGEWSFGDSVQLSLARVTNKFIPFSRLTSGFPAGKSEMRLAYLQSYSMTDFIMKNFFGKGGLKPFLKRLENPRESFEIISKLYDPLILRSLETQWKQNLGARWRNVFYVTLSGVFFWFLITLLFLFAYLKKRRMKKEQTRIWEEEEFQG